MKIHDILEHFSSFTSVPVDPDDLAAEIKKAGIRDEINFVEVDIDERILRGALHTHVYTPGVYGEPQVCSDIFYSKGLTRAWRRFVCCKELLHILDNSVSVTATQQDFEALIAGLCTTPDTANPFDASGLQVWGDRLMIYYATAVIFPLRVREVILDAFGDTPDIPQVAKWLDVPERVAALVLSDHWPSLYKALLGRK